MITLKLAIGVAFLITGWVFLYKPNLLQYLNQQAREHVFNDRILLLHRKKLAVVFFCLSVLALYMGLTSYIKSGFMQGKDTWVVDQNKFTMYLAMQDYCCGRYDESVAKSLNVLGSDPQNIDALENLALSYKALGNTEKAKSAMFRLFKLRPDNKKIFEELKKLEETKESRKKK